MTDKKEKPNRSKGTLLWCFTTYFAEGFPYSVIRVLTSVFFTDIGMKERYIGYSNFLGIPWNFKFLWAPFLDLFGTRRGWMVVLQGIISVLIAVLAIVCWIFSYNVDSNLFMTVSFSLLIVLAFLSATNDVAIDAYYMEAIPDKKDQAAYTGWRVFAWRMALITVRSGLVALVPWVAAYTFFSGNKVKPWAAAFAAASIIMFVVTIYHFFALPKVRNALSETKKSVSEILFGFSEAFSTYLDRKPQKLLSTIILTVIISVCYAFVSFQILIPSYKSFEWLWLMLIPTISIAAFVGQMRKQIALMLLFIIFYKVGDEVLFSMGTTFLMRELLVTKVDLAWLAGILGVVGSISGTFLGGMWIKKHGFSKSVWPLTLFMNVNIMAYAWLAWHKPLATTFNGLMTIASVYTYEQFASGLGGAVLIVYILRTCKPEFKASHYAVGSAIMSLFSTFFGGLGGRIVESMGYLNMFLLAFSLTIPAMGLIFVAPMGNEK